MRNKIIGIMICTLFVLTCFTVIPNVFVKDVKAEINVIFSDDFEDGNYNDWNPTIGTWTIVYDLQIDQTFGHMLCGVEQSDQVQGIIKTEVFFPHNLEFSADMRLVDTVPWWHRGIAVHFKDNPDKEFRFQYRGDTFELMLNKMNFGSENEIILGLYNIPGSQSLGNQWDNLKIEINNDNIKCYLNNELIFDLIDSDLLNTDNWYVSVQAGFSRSYFDNCIVKSNYYSEIAIDIKPGDYPNTINPKSKGKIPVAILTNDDFDASEVNPDSINFLSASPSMWSMDDVDINGDIDLLLLFNIPELNFDLLVDEGDEYPYAYLIGETISGEILEGKDTVRLVGQTFLQQFLERLIQRFPLFEKILNQII